MTDLNHSLKQAQAWTEHKAITFEDRQEVAKWIKNGENQKILESFYRDLEFGTGGLRAKMGLGTNRYNKYTVGRATQALAIQVLAYAKKKGDTVPKVAIGYDSRNFSQDYAAQVACIMAANGIHAFLFEYLTPVALLSYSVRFHQAHAGIMITASHNPPEYNGYKVYWDDGAQVIPPYDKQIIDTYLSLSDWSQVKMIDYEQALANKLIHVVGKNVEDAYFEELRTKIINPGICQEKGSELKIVYTPIHGTGLATATRILTEMGFSKVYVPKDQANPDGNFPTVKSPNPENPDALAMAVELMEKEKADIVFGTDPDTDRLGVAIKHKGEIFYPNGNQIGLLMLHYILENLSEQKRLPSHPYFIKTIVTTELQAIVAKHFGIEVFNTLTGFKWICGKMREIEQSNPEKNFIFATEESFGYMTHNFVRDKDGICSIAIMAEVALWYKLKGMDLVDGLNSIYEKYGFSNESLLCLDYEGKEGAEKINRIMELFRKTFIKEMAGEKILLVEDYLAQEIKDVTTDVKTTLKLPKSNVLGYTFASGNKLYLRPSGTEPKIKFYIMVQIQEGNLEVKKKKAHDQTQNFLNFIKGQAQMA